MKNLAVSSWGIIGAIAVSLFLLAYPPVPSISLLTDSDQYKEMSDALLTAKFYKAYDGTELPLTLSLRPPMYPLMLLIAKSLSQHRLEHGIALTHLFLCFLTLTIAPFVLRSVLSPFITVCATGIALYSNKQLVYCHMSEFLASILILFAFFSLIRLCYSPSLRKSAALTCLVSLAILTRLALLPWLSLVAIAPWLASKAKRGSVMLGIFIGIAPLLLWAAFNLYRLDSFSLGAHGSYLYVAAARTLGEIPLYAEDTAHTSLLIKEFNHQGRGVSPQGWAPEKVQRWEGEYYWAHHWNFDLAIGSLRPLIPKTSPLQLLLRTIGAHPNNYVALLRGSLYTILSEYALIITVSILIQLIILFKLPRYKPLALASLAICTSSVLYMGSIFIAFLWVHRYFTSVQPVLIFSVFSGLGVLLYERFGR